MNWRATLFASAALALVAALGPVQAAEGDEVGVVEKEQGAVESFFYEVWSQVSSMSPSTSDAGTPEGMTVTAGLRGAEGESQAMEPYWKGDLTQDPAFRKEIQAYQQALEKGRDGNPQALQRFLREHGGSDLAPNARFALGVAHAETGNNSAARKVLEEFRQKHPKHPLAEQAQAVIERLGA